MELATGIGYVRADGKTVNESTAAIGNKALRFVGTSGAQWWLASQAGHVGGGLEIVSMRKTVNQNIIAFAGGAAVRQEPGHFDFDAVFAFMACTNQISLRF